MLVGHIGPVQPALSCRTLRKLPSSIKAGSINPVISMPYRRHHHRPSLSPPTNFIASRRISDLGLRSQRPPDSTSDSNDSPPSSEVPDHEWEIRTGRAIYVIQETLPDFFETGLVTSVNKTTGMPSRYSFFTPPTNISFLEPPLLKDDEEPIYSPNIRLSYTPPSQLPAPFPKTFHIEGLQLYLTSSGIIRHTMNALYHNLALKTNKLVINSAPSTPNRGNHNVNRDKSFLVRQTVIGISRVSGKPSEWEIESTFTFSPTTGLVHQHIVNAIHPAPHLAVYDSLRLSLGKLLGWELGSGATTNGAACKGNEKS